MFEAQGEGDIFIDRHMRPDGVVLENHADVAFARRQIGDIFAVDDDAPGGDFLQPGDHAHRGGFAAARGTQQYQKFTFVDF